MQENVLLKINRMNRMKRVKLFTTILLCNEFFCFIQRSQIGIDKICLNNVTY